uniref:Uncharacterized protein n=1 Tax=Eutreptiella gymnastica TaxID=73025 RepID=A0A7S1NIV0_9EUGL
MAAVADELETQAAAAADRADPFTERMREFQETTGGHLTDCWESLEAAEQELQELAVFFGAHGGTFEPLGFFDAIWCFAETLAKTRCTTTHALRSPIEGL